MRQNLNSYASWRNILGDDIAYIRDVDSTARAVNVESGIFGIIQDVNPKDDALIYKLLTNLEKSSSPTFWLKMANPTGLEWDKNFLKKE